jgi:amino acid transporter
MRAFRAAVTALLVLGLCTSGFAGDLEKSVATAAEQEETRSQKTGRSTALVWAGTALFVGGMAVGLSSFINNKNGEFAEFGEASAVNKHLGAAGLSAAFAGGVLIFLGSHGLKHAPAVSVGAGQVKVSKQLSW